MLDRLERRLGKYALSNLPILLVAGQAGAFALSIFKPEFVEKLWLVPSRVFEGEVWRVVTFVFVPPFSGGYDEAGHVAPPSGLTLIWLVIALWFLFFVTRTLEASWGEFKFNVYLFVGWLSAVIAAFIIPGAIASNAYLFTSMFLALCYIAPEIEILLMLIIPVKIKWLGYLTWAFFTVMLVIGGWATRLLILAATLNWFLFFGRDLYLRLRGASRRRVGRAKERIAAMQPNHRCESCGITDLDDPEMSFRYCSTCVGKRGYCKDHIRSHEHVRG